MDPLSLMLPRRTVSTGSIPLEPLSRTLTISNDGYDYTDAGVAPEDAPTTGAQAGGPQRTEPTIGDKKQLALARRAPDGTLRLWTRWIDGGWRPKVPDEESAIVELPPGTSRSVSVSTNTSRTARQENIRDFEIMHNWTQTVDHDEAVFHLNVVHRPTGNAQTTTGVEKASIEGHIRWVHSEEAGMTHTKFEDLFLRYASQHVDSGVRDLTRRLLKRVWATDERDFIGGKFLTPATTRYDGQSKNDDEKPCTFFNFPYFSVEKPHTKMYSKAESPGPNLEHPVRTLLQSRYRLEATDGRDGDQSITKLSRSEVRTCIRTSQKYDEENFNNNLEPIIHVPQLWCLSLSGDVMVTSGPISEGALRGSAVMMKDTNVQLPHAGRGPPLVRILLEHSGKQQPFLYPTNQCDWWFGLLNKQRQILRSLKDGSDRKVTFGEYKFYKRSEASDESLVDIHNWHDTLKKERSEKIDLWIINPNVPNLRITEDTDDEAMDAGGTTSFSDGRKSEVSPSLPRSETSVLRSHPAPPSVAQPASLSASTSARTIAATPSESAGERPNVSYVLFDAAILPFFEWPFRNDEGKLDRKSPEDKVKLWLKRIRATLQVKYSTMIEEGQASGAAPTPGLLSQVTVHPRQKKIRLCSYAEVCARLTQPETRNSRYITDMKRLCVEAELLFRLFIPDKSKPAPSQSSGSRSSIPQQPLEHIGAEHTADREAIGLYWGAVDTIIFCLSQHEGPQVETEELLEGLKQIISGASELHLGMRSLRSVHAERQDGPEQENDAEIRLLLEVIVDAFEAVFGILIGAVNYLWAQAAAHDGSSRKFSRFIGNHVKEGSRLLAVAKARLIVEADEINHDKGLGPVVTPEGIIIMLLERLSRGVHQNATIDVMDLYEKIVEKIALKVEKSASRRLLLEINRVSEELDIINDVLRQQKWVLTPFQASLDPTTFKTASIPRKMKFQYESKSIDEILKAINESIVDCAELRERASRLAIQNVQLVETKLEDNSKAIIVFTVVTIFFLPLTFVSGFFGMNVVGISGTTSTVKHFWVIALPVTIGVVFLCLFAAFLGSIKRWIQRYAKRRKEKNS